MINNSVKKKLIVVSNKVPCNELKYSKLFYVGTIWFTRKTGIFVIHLTRTFVCLFSVVR